MSDDLVEELLLAAQREVSSIAESRSYSVHARAEGASDMLRFIKKRIRSDARLRDAIVQAVRATGVEAAAKLVESHSCVSSCCDAQLSAVEAKALAACIRNSASGPR